MRKVSMAKDIQGLPGAGLPQYLYSTQKREVWVHTNTELETGAKLTSARALNGIFLHLPH